MVIKTGVKQGRPSLPAKRPFGNVYKAIKAGLQYSGYYDKYELWRYDPEDIYEKHVGKYTYKPRKRLAGYLGQTLHAKKKFRSSSYYQFYQERSKVRRWRKWYNYSATSSKSGKHPIFNNAYGRVSGVYYQGNVRYD